jgi:hypothetical protein
VRLRQQGNRAGLGGARGSAENGRAQQHQQGRGVQISGRPGPELAQAVPQAGALQRPGELRGIGEHAGVAGIQVDAGQRQAAQFPHRIPEQLVALGFLGPAQAAPDDIRQPVRFHDDDVVAGADSGRQLADPPPVARRRDPPGRGQLSARIPAGQVVGDDDRNRVRPRGGPVICRTACISPGCPAA